MKTVFITGASSGIGKATAVYFADKGWNVAATMRRPERDQSMGTLKNVKLYQLDVVDSASIKKAIDAALKDFGQIEVLVNNAGYGAIGPMQAATNEQIRKQFDVNLFGAIEVTRAMLSHFNKVHKGRIINISSIGGVVGFPLFSIYSASKWAIEGFSESLQYEVEPLGVDVKIVEPGGVNTDFTGRSIVTFDMSRAPEYLEVGLKAMRNFEKIKAQNSPPEQIAKVIFDAAVDETSKFRFVAGDDANQLIQLRRNSSFEDFREAMRMQMLG